MIQNTIEQSHQNTIYVCICVRPACDFLKLIISGIYPVKVKPLEHLRTPKLCITADLTVHNYIHNLEE